MSAAAQNPSKADVARAMANAVRLGNVYEAEQLLRDFNADPNGTIGGHPLICLAAKVKKPGMTELLLKSGADPNAANPAGESAAEVAVKSFHDANLRQLIKAGANPSYRNAARETIGEIILKGIHVAYAEEDATQFRKHEKTAVTDKWARLALALSIDPDSKLEGFPAVTLAVRMGDSKSLKELIAAGANLSATTPDGDCALILAARGQKPEYAALLLDAGADPHQQDARGETAATILLKAAIASALQEKVCESYQRDDLKKKAAACEDFALAVVAHPSYTAAGDAKNSALPLAVALKTRAVFDLLLEKGVAVNAVTNNGDCALHAAAINCRQDLFEEILQKGASLLQKNKEQQIPLDSLKAAFEKAADTITYRQEKRRITQDEAKAEHAAWEKLKTWLTEATAKETASLEGVVAQPVAVRNKPFQLKPKAQTR